MILRQETETAPQHREALVYGIQITIGLVTRKSIRSKSIPFLRQKSEDVDDLCLFDTKPHSKRSFLHSTSHNFVMRNENAPAPKTSTCLGLARNQFQRMQSWVNNHAVLDTPTQRPVEMGETNQRLSCDCWAERFNKEHMG